jgi:hypothetical protein
MGDVFELVQNRVPLTTIAEAMGVDTRTLKRYVYGAKLCGYAYWDNRWERRRANALYEANKRNDKTVPEVRVGGLTALEVFIIEELRRLRAHDAVVLGLRAKALGIEQPDEGVMYERPKQS